MISDPWIMISPSAFRQESELYRLVRTSVDARTATETFLLCPYRRIILHLYNPLRTQIDTFSATRTRSVYVKSSCPPSVHVYRSRYVTEDVHKDVFLDTDSRRMAIITGPNPSHIRILWSRTPLPSSCPHHQADAPSCHPWAV